MMMTLARIGFRNTLAAAVLGIAGTLVSGTTAHAQQIMMVDATFGPSTGGAGGGRVSSRSIDAYSRLLGLDQDQAEIARELHQQYVMSVDEANQERRSAMKRLMEEFQETEDHEIFQKDMPELTDRIEKQLAAFEASLFSDLRLLLNDEQAARWERVERLRRRETTLKSGALSGETVDLLAVTDSVVGDEAMDADVREALDQYELELDRALVSKARMLKDIEDDFSGTSMTFDLEAMQELGEKTREAGIRVRDVNRRYARVIESLLPEELADTFREETKRRTFPQVFRESRVDRLVAAAEKLSDLEPDQQASVKELGVSYVRERGAADTKWAAAISKDDEEGGSGVFAGSMVIRMMDENAEKSPVAQARSDRRALDKKYEERLMAVLNEEQRKRMPKPDENQRRDGVQTFDFNSGGAHMIIDRSPDRE
jgi:Spy/CpxP family protein refolding chaperone